MGLRADCFLLQKIPASRTVVSIFLNRECLTWTRQSFRGVCSLRARSQGLPIECASRPPNVKVKNVLWGRFWPRFPTNSFSDRNASFKAIRSKALGCLGSISRAATALWAALIFAGRDSGVAQKHPTQLAANRSSPTLQVPTTDCCHGYFML